jgi:hypothetical protein
MSRPKLLSRHINNIMSKKTITKPAVKADTVKSELHGNAAVLGSPLQQVWKKKRGFCIVKGCRNKADKGHFCSQHASARTRLKAKGEKVEEPVDFEAVAAAKPKAVKKVAKPKAVKKVVVKKVVAPKVVAKKVVTPKAVKPKAKKESKTIPIEIAGTTIEAILPTSPAAETADDSTLL